MTEQGFTHQAIMIVIGFHSSGELFWEKSIPKFPNWHTPEEDLVILVSNGLICTSHTMLGGGISGGADKLDVVQVLRAHAPASHPQPNRNQGNCKTRDSLYSECRIF